jgi:acetylglutamate kinase
MAVACAASFRVDRLLFLTDVDGVKDGAGQILPTLTVRQCRDLIASGVATGGMQAKLESACDALKQGVGEVRIAPGARISIVRELLENENVGTRIIA